MLLADTSYLCLEVGSLTKKVKLEVKHVLSTPQSAPQSSKTSAPKHFVLENNSTTPTLPQGAAAERQLLLQKKDVSSLVFYFLCFAFYNNFSF